MVKWKASELTSVDNQFSGPATLKQSHQRVDWLSITETRLIATQGDASRTLSNELEKYRLSKPELTQVNSRRD